MADEVPTIVHTLLERLANLDVAGRDLGDLAPARDGQTLHIRTLGGRESQAGIGCGDEGDPAKVQPWASGHSGDPARQAEGLAFERELLAQAFASTDAAEGLIAYKEKRVARFEGK